MYLKKLILIIVIIFIRKHMKCCAGKYKFNANNHTVWKGTFLNDLQGPGSKIQTQQQPHQYRYINKRTLRAINSNIYWNSSTSKEQQQQQQRYQSAIESISDLYFFSSDHVRGIFNCSYDQTINITQNAKVLANGSYIYDNQTLIPPQLVGNYDYEILYNGSQRQVPQHQRACICQLKPCISVCSKNIAQTFQYVVDNAMFDALNIFLIDMTLANGSVVIKNIAQDFAGIVMQEYCEVSYMLIPENDIDSKWTLFENGSLLLESDGMQLKRSAYCFDLAEVEINKEKYHLINPLICAEVKKTLSLLEEFNYWTQVLSIIFLLLIMIVYLCLPELLNVHGKCLMSYVGTLMLSFAIFAFIKLSQITFDPVPCLIMAYSNYYLQVAHYTWLGIICYDICQTIKDPNYKCSYLRYAMFGYPLPFVMTLLTWLAENLITNDDLIPGISADRCGLDVFKWAAAIYLYGPCLIILIICLICFILTSRHIKTNDREVKESCVNYNSYYSQRRYAVFFRLFLIMGISWFLDILSYICHMMELPTGSGIMDYINSLQGVYIFLNLIGRSKIRNMLQRKFMNGRAKR